MRRQAKDCTALSAIVFIFLPVCLAQANYQSGVATTTTAASVCRIEGFVVDSTSGAFVPRADLQALQMGIAGARPVNVTSDVSGHFLFSSLTPGEYEIEAQGEGYPSQAYGHPISLTSTRCSRLISFNLRPGGVITGYVTDGQGQPMAKVRVLATTEMKLAGLGGYARIGSGQTNNQGRFQIRGLDEGQYFVVAMPKLRSLRATTASGEMYVPEVYPGTRDPDAFTPITINLGDSVGGIDFALTPVHTAELGGKVVSAITGQPLSHSRVALQSSNFVLRITGMYSRPIYTDAKGRFVIERVPPGPSVLMSFSSSNSATLCGQLTADPQPGEKLEDIRLVDSRLPEISGTVSADSSSGLSLSSLRIRLNPAESNPVFRTGLAGVRVDGTFVFQSILPGQYRLTVENLPSKYYLKSGTLDGTDVLQNGFDLVAGASTATMAIALGSDGAVIMGTVLQQDYRPAVGASVVLIPDAPERNRSDLYKVTKANAMGLFTFMGIAPGDYKIIACQEIDDPSCRGLSPTRRSERLGRSVNVQEGEQQNIELKTVTMGASTF